MEEKVKQLIEKRIQELGFLLDDVTYEKEGSTYFLRIVIDKSTPVTIDDCVLVTREINPILDQADFLEESYMLDICSKEKGCEENA